MKSAAAPSSPIPIGTAAITRPSRRPEHGLAVARMVGHVTYLSEYAMTRKFGRNLQPRANRRRRRGGAFRRRKLSSPSGRKFRQPVRSQFLSLSDQGAGPVRFVWRPAAGGSFAPGEGAFSGHLLRLRLALSAGAVAGIGAPAQARPRGRDLHQPGNPLRARFVSDREPGVRAASCGITWTMNTARPAHGGRRGAVSRAMHPGIYQSVLDWIPDGARVLDLGTGDGAFLERLSRPSMSWPRAWKRIPNWSPAAFSAGWWSIRATSPRGWTVRRPDL